VNNRVGRSTLITVGLIALLVGGVWVLQGLNLIPGSFMSGDQKWFIIGLIVAVVGIILAVLGLRRPRGSSTRSSRTGK
jgi:uncharacterized membrane protein SirB2